MGWFNNLKTWWKMFIGFSTMIFFMVVIGAAGFLGANIMGNNLGDVFRTRLPSLDYLVQADRDLQQLLVAERSMIFSSVDSETFKQFLAAYEENLLQSEERWEKYKKLASKPEEKSKIGQYETARQEWKEVSRQVVDSRLADTREGRRMALDLTLNQAQAKFEAMRGHLNDLQELNLNLAAQANAEAEEANRRVEATVVVCLGLGVCVGVFLTWLITRSIVGPLSKSAWVVAKLSVGSLRERVGISSGDEVGRLSQAVDDYMENMSQLVDLLGRIGDGDLTIQAPVRSEEDEIRPVVQKMVENLRDMVEKVTKASERLTAGSSEVANSSQALSQGATEQAASLEEIASAMTQVGAQTKSNAENAQQADQLSKSSRGAAENGAAQMEDMIRAMNEINNSSKEIAKIIKAVDDIAFQTNLLALNAAVEAARAGKHGQGFAVVAQEVRALAGRSAAAAQETAELIEGSLKKVGKGTQIAGQTALALKEIVEGVTKVADLVGEIAASSNEQAKGIAEINTGLKQVEQVTQSNTANAEETASAATELSSLARGLHDLLSRFKLRASAEREAVPSGPVRALEAPRGNERSLWREPGPSGWDRFRQKEKLPQPEDVISLDGD
ncbi:MAG: methyl-accepting chemotaxis protein [Pseudomonadota bacterium]